MADLDELEATVYTLTEMGADVATYNIPQDVLNDVERMSKGDEVVHDIAEKQSGETASE